jgi:hypothetical protein
MAIAHVSLELRVRRPGKCHFNEFDDQEWGVIAHQDVCGLPKFL